MSYNQFKQQIIQNSKFSIYNDAIKEWEYIGEFKTTGCDKCICGKSIKNVIIIHNKKTNNNLHVGTSCVNKLDELTNIKNMWTNSQQPKISRKEQRILNQINLVLNHQTPNNNIF